jgi:hypothetical protein
MLILERVGLGVQIENIPLYHVDFWVQVHNLPTGLMAERVGKTLANYIGSFVEYDKNNIGSFWREYMRLKVRVDIRQPLKKETRVKNQGGAWCTVNFKYEKLGVFCFVCGIIGHSENRCAIRFSMAEDDGSRAWSKEIRAEPRRRGGRQTSRWLMEEEGDRSAHEERQSQSHVSHNEQVDPTETNIPSPSPNRNRSATINQQLLLGPFSVPPANQDRPVINQPLMLGPVLVPPTNKDITDNTDSLINRRLTLQHSLSQQESLSTQQTKPIIDLDNKINEQLIPNHNQPSTTYTLSPTLTNTLNQNIPHQFTFNSGTVSNFKQQTNPTTRLIKHNPNQKPTRIGPLRTGPKHDPSKPVPDPNQSSTASMETQTEKKRRREEEKKTNENSTENQHFLTVGPGSQACRDQ